MIVRYCHRKQPGPRQFSAGFPGYSQAHVPQISGFDRDPKATITDDAYAYPHIFVVGWIYIQPLKAGSNTLKSVL
jgi:hypothetical protein